MMSPFSEISQDLQAFNSASKKLLVECDNPSIPTEVTNRYLRLSSKAKKLHFFPSLIFAINLVITELLLVRHFSFEFDKEKRLV
jgi:hypothetical protein